MRKTAIAAVLLVILLAGAELLVPPARDAGAASQLGAGALSILEPSALTVDTAAYGTGDLIGKHTDGYLTFASACRVAGGGGRILQAILADDDAESAAIDLVLFSSLPSGTTFTDNAALDVADADLDKIVGYIVFAGASYKAFADNSVIVVTGVDQRYLCAGSTTLYGALVSRGTPTYTAATDLVLRLVVERE